MQEGKRGSRPDRRNGKMGPRPGKAALGKGMGPTKQPDGSFALFMGTKDAKLSWCTVEDIGGVSAAVIAEGPKKWGGKTVGVSGEHATAAEVAEILTKALGKPVGCTSVDAEAWAAAVQTFGVPELVAKDLGNMFAFYEKCGMLELRPLAQTKSLYPETQSMEAWIGKHKDELLGAMV